MELHQIRYFLAVARELHFSRAAIQCNVTQPALTRAIQKLEDELGGALFDRRPGRIELTMLGRTLLPRFEAALKEVSDARSDARILVELQRRQLRLGLTCTIGPSRVAELIGDLYDRIEGLELVVREGLGSTIADLLERNEIDAAVVGLPFHSTGFDVTPLYRERFVIALPPGHPLLERERVKLNDLGGQNYLDRLHCEFNDYFETQHGHWPIALNVVFASEREDWIQGLLGAGLGCAIVPEFQQLGPHVETRPLIDPVTYREISVVTRVGAPNTVPLAEFIAIARAYTWTRKLAHAE